MLAAGSPPRASTARADHVEAAKRAGWYRADDGDTARPLPDSRGISMSAPADVGPLFDTCLAMG
jgi:hypothetical protein